MSANNSSDGDLDYGRFASSDPNEAVKIDKQAGAPSWNKQEGPNKLVVILATLLSVLVLGGIIIGFLTWVEAPQEALLVTVPIEEYSDLSWQVNPWASDDSELLAMCFRRGQRSGGTGLATVAIGYQNAETFRRLLAWIGGEKDNNDTVLKGDLTDRPLVLHISALGSTYRDVPYIVPGDGQRSDPWTNWKRGDQDAWVRIEEVLNAMKKCTATKKLLLLDVSHPSHDAFLGPLRNDVSTKLHELLEQWEKEKKLEFPVLVSTGPNQFSWPSDPDECSGFAYYVADALRGKADGYNDSTSQDDKVSVRELANFVTARVSRWAKMVHGQNQRPVSYGLNTRAAEFFITLRGLEPAQVPPQREGYSPVLQDWWGTRSHSPDLNLYHPLRTQQLTASLLRAEEYWLRASNTAWSGRVATIRERAADRWREKIPSGSHVADPYAAKHSRLLNQASQFRQMIATAEEKESPADPYLNALISGKLKDEELDKLREAWENKAQQSPMAATVALWEQGRRYTRWTKTTLKAWGDLAHQITHPLAQEGYSRGELILFRRLSSWDITSKRGIATFPAQEIQQLLNAEHELCQLLKLGPEGFALVENDLQKAEVIRRAIYREYFTKVTRPLDIRTQLRDITTEYRQASQTLEEWRRANRVLRELTATLHDLMPGVVNELEPSFNDWKTAVDIAKALNRVLAEAQVNKSYLRGSAEGLIVQANRALVRLRPVQTVDTINKILQDTAPRDKPEKLEKIFRLVVNTSGPFQARKTVWEELRNDHAKLVENLRNSDRTDDENKPKSITKPESLPLPRTEDSSVIRRVDVVEQMLNLSSFENIEAFRQSVSLVRANPASPDAVEKFAAASDLTWFQVLSDQTRALMNAEKYLRVLQVLRAIPGEVIRSPKASVWFDQFDPVSELIQLDAEAYRKFLYKVVETDRSIRVGDETVDAESDPFFASRLADLLRAFNE